MGSMLEKDDEQCGCRIITIEETFPFPLARKVSWQTHLTSADPYLNGKWFTYVQGYSVVLTKKKKENNKPGIKHTIIGDN